MSNAHVRRQMEGIMERMRATMNDEAKADLVSGARYLVSVVLHEMKGFENVTGNMRNSIAVGLFYDGVIQGIATSFDELHHAPTRMTLAAGEEYDLTYYWDGTEVQSLGRPYRAPKDSPQKESFWAQAEALEFVQTMSPRRKGWSYVVVSAVDYAKYLEARNEVNILTNLRNQLASMGAEVSDLI